jgi:prepilin-type N-terminal cleavage/methylation domain-containing protein
MPPIHHFIVKRPLIRHRPAGERGFSLVEMTVVLLVMSVVLAGVLPLLAERTDSQASDITEERMKTIENAMSSYVAANDELPCPADNTAGYETLEFGTADCAFDATTSDNNGVSATVGVGGVPVKTLGLSDDYAFDGWGRRFTYYVDATLTVAASLDDDPGNGPFLTVQDKDANDRTTEALYSIISHGPSGHGAYLRSGQPYSAGVTPLENANTDGDEIIVQRSAVSSSSLAARFDDIVRYRTYDTLNLGAGGGGSTVSAVGSDGWVQFNTGDSFDAELELFWDKTNNRLGVGTGLPSNTLTVLGTSLMTGSGANGGAQLLSGAAGTSSEFTLGRTVTEARLGVAGAAAGISNFATAGDTVLRAETEDLILTARNATGAIRFGTAAADTEKVTILNNGRMGIGTTTPQTMLHVAVGATGLAETQYTNAATGHTATDGFAVGVEQNANTAYLWNYENGLMVFGTNNTEHMFITNAGNVGIGTESPVQLLHMHRAGAVESALQMTNGTTGVTTTDGFYVGVDDAGHSYVWQFENLPLIFATNNTARMTIGANGEVTLSGNITAVGFFYSSDERLKADIDPVKEEMLTAILALEPVRYRFKADEKKEKRIGFLAQAVQKQFPELVKADEKGMLSLDYAALTVPLVKAVQELATQQKALETRVVALESKAAESATTHTTSKEALTSVPQPEGAPTLPLSQVLLLVLAVSTLQTLLFLAISRRRK